MIGTFPPKRASFGRLTADAANRTFLGFAPCGVLRDAEDQTSGPAYPASLCQDCYPSLTFWPGPARVGPFFADLCSSRRQGTAHAPDRGDLRCQRAEIAVNSRATITLNRGRSSCKNSSFLALSQPPCRLALATTPSAPLPVRRPARSSRRQPAATCLWGLRLALALAPCATTCASAARLTRARARGQFLSTAIRGANPSGGRFAFTTAPRPGRPFGRAPCLTRS